MEKKKNQKPVVIREHKPITERQESKIRICN